MLRNAFVLLIAMIALTTTTQSAIVRVGARESFPGPAFVPDSVKIASGDTLSWYLIDGSHTTTSGTGSSDPQAGVMYDSNVDFFTPMFEFQFSTPGTYQNFCIPHEVDGMKGKIVVTPAVAAHIRASAGVVGAFDPDSVLIHPGQTVEFYWSNGDHTLTSGTGSADPNAGDLIDSPLNDTIPAIQLTFNTAGTYPFFCRPHELDGMKTKVYVVCPCPNLNDPNRDGVNDILDVGITINVAFRGSAAITDPGCPQQLTDYNGDGVTDILDVGLIINVAFRGANKQATFDDDGCTPGNQ